MRRHIDAESDALRSYLAGRTGCFRETHMLYNELLVWLEARSSNELREGPTFNATLYRAARDLYRSYRQEHAQESDPHDIPWEPARASAPEGYDELLHSLRGELGEDAEILDLRCARGLGIGEIAFVLRADLAETERRLGAALAWAGFVHEASGCAADLGQAIHDAFQIVPAFIIALAKAPQARSIKLGAGTVLGDRYRIETCIGGGEFGYVYRAADVRVPGHTVAIKVTHRAARTEITREGAIRELTLIASAVHPSLVQFKDHGWWQQRLWFVMPWYEGETLETRLQRGPMDTTEATALAAAVARALAALHAVGLIHQDVKPENIFLARMGSPEHEETVPILLDLGVASPESNVAVAGTPLYFAPEAAARICNPEATVSITGKADVYALALTLQHTLAPGTRPTIPDDELDAFIEERAVAIKPEVPRRRALRQVRKVLLSALNVEPEDRPTALEFAALLAPIGADTGRSYVQAAGVVGLGLAAAACLTVGAQYAMHERGARIELIDARADALAAEQRLASEIARAESLEQALEEARRPRLAEATETASGDSAAAEGEGDDADTAANEAAR